MIVILNAVDDMGKSSFLFSVSQSVNWCSVPEGNLGISVKSNKYK